jgi:hypothetical protein
MTFMMIDFLDDCKLFITFSKRIGTKKVNK